MNKPKIQFTTSILLTSIMSILTVFIEMFSFLTGTVGGAAESTKSNKPGPYQYDNGEDEV